MSAAVLVEHVRAALALIGVTDGVERGATGAPVAFRIWRAGDNETDMGTHRFTDRSAAALLAAQDKRGNLFSIDVDHLSLSKQAPPEARKAVGFHRLAVREGAQGPELWAVDVEWTDAVRAGLEKSPPEWRYFSPAYDVDKRTGEIVAYLNTALTNNPATWGVTALATRAFTRIGAMNYADIVAALFGDDDEKKKEARSTLAGMSDVERKAFEAVKRAAFADPEDKPKDKPADEAATTASAPSESDDEKKKREEAAAAAAATARQAATAREAELLGLVGSQDKRIKDLEARNVATERAEILATRPDLSDVQRAALSKKSPGELREILALIPKPSPADPAAAARVTATRGDGRGDGGGFGAMRAARLPPDESRDLALRMGRDPEPARVHWHPHKPNDLVFPLLSRDDARAILANRARQGPPRNPALARGVTAATTATPAEEDR